MNKLEQYIEKYREIHDREVAPVFEDMVSLHNYPQWGVYGDGWNLVKKFFPFIIEYQIKKQRKITLLDYGCGQATYLDNFNEPPLAAVKLLGGCSFKHFMDTRIESLQCYDPAVTRFANKPTTQFDVVANSDVMEHIPEECVDDVLRDICSFVKPDGLLLFCITGDAAKLYFKEGDKVGENLHCTQKSFAWWCEKVEAAAGNTAYMMMYLNENELIVMDNKVSNTKRIIKDSSLYTIDKRFYIEYLAKVEKMGLDNIKL